MSGINVSTQTRLVGDWLKHYLRFQFLQGQKLRVVTDCWKQDSIMVLGEGEGGHCSWLSTMLNKTELACNQVSQCRTILLITLNNTAPATLLHPVSNNFWLLIMSIPHNTDAYVVNGTRLYIVILQSKNLQELYLSIFQFNIHGHRLFLQSLNLRTDAAQILLRRNSKIFHDQSFKYLLIQKQCDSIYIHNYHNIWAKISYILFSQMGIECDN